MTSRTSASASVEGRADPSATPQIELAGVRKVFGDRGGDVVAVNDVDLTVDDGELFAILGPSGSGKTTVLRMIATSPGCPRAGGTSTPCSRSTPSFPT